MSNEHVSKEARLSILEEEITTVRWLASKAADDERKAAASLRVLELQQEIDRMKAA